MEGHGQPPGRYGLALGAFRLLVAEDVPGNQHVQHAVAGGFSLLGETVGPTPGRVLGQGDEQRAFCPCQLGWCLAEVEPRGSSNAVNVTAKGGRDEVEVEDFVLVEATLQLPRAQDFQHFCLRRAVWARFQQARGLHTQGRAA